jgi:hypothetical protein
LTISHCPSSAVCPELVVDGWFFTISNFSVAQNGARYECSLNKEDKIIIIISVIKIPDKMFTEPSGQGKDYTEIKFSVTLMRLQKLLELCSNKG